MKAILLLMMTALALSPNPIEDDTYLTYIVDPAKQDVQLFWKNENDEPLKSIKHLQFWLEKNNRKLLFAANAGMYTKDNAPKGLYIEKQQVLSPLDTSNGSGNFYLKPNGVFYITSNNIAAVCPSTEFILKGNIKYATQSGPLLLSRGKIHPAFDKGSANLNIRNGVGILPGNKIVFVMSTRKVNFYDFAKYFQSIGCTNALYLDGLVSRTYLPEKNWIQTDGDFGVMIAVTKG